MKEPRIRWNDYLLDDIIDMVARDAPRRALAIKAARRRIAGLRLQDQIKKTAELNWAISLKDG